MKRRRLLLILSGCIASIALAFLVSPCEHEPEYGGVRLSEWLERYARTHSKNSDLAAASKAIDAIQHMGTNTLPFLVRWIQYERPAWREHLYDASWKLPQNFQYSRTISHLLTLGDKRHRADIAADAFLILRRRGRPAAPELKRLAVQFPMTETNGRALWCLECIKSDDSFY